MDTFFFITDGFHNPRDTKVHSVFTLQWCPLFFLTQSSVPLVSRQSGFTVLNSTSKLLIVLTTILFVYVTLRFFHYYAFNMS